MTSFQVDQSVIVRYKNHRGSISDRKILPIELSFKSNQWYPKPQWILRVFDFDKQAEREFALRNVMSWGIYDD